MSRDRVNHITEENTILKAENAALREKVDYTTLVISDLNTKLKRLEEENQSYIAALNILQVDELQFGIQKPGKLQQLICKTTSYNLNNLKYHRLCTSQYKSPHPQSQDIAGNRIHLLC